MKRLERIIDRADELQMVVVLGYFYFGQDERLRDEAAVIRATHNATQWIFDRGYRNVLVEIKNDCDNARYDHAILRPRRVHEPIDRRMIAAMRSLNSSTVSTGRCCCISFCDEFMMKSREISDLLWQRVRESNRSTCRS